MEDYKDFDLDVKRIIGSSDSVGLEWQNSIIVCPSMETCPLTKNCRPKPSYGGDRGCGPTTSANSRIIDR